VLRLPNGKRLERRFLGEEKVQVLFDFIDSTSEETGFELGSYSLAIPPKRILTDRSITLKEAGLFPRALISIQL